MEEIINHDKATPMGANIMAASDFPTPSVQYKWRGASLPPHLTLNSPSKLMARSSQSDGMRYGAMKFQVELAGFYLHLSWWRKFSLSE